MSIKPIYIKILVLVIRIAIGSRTWNDIVEVVKDIDTTTLTDQQKRSAAFVKIKEILKKREQEIKDNPLNLLIELAVALLKLKEE